MKKIFIFGDSVVLGQGDEMSGGFVNKLKEFFSNFEIHNLAIDGGTIIDTQETFEKVKDKNPDTIIFEAGGNDSAYDKESGEFLVNLDKFEKIVSYIIISAKNITENIIFMGFTNCDERKTMPVSWCSLIYENKNIKKYNDIIKNICEKNNILFIDTFGVLENNDFSDGLHPNPSGHEKIFEYVKNFIK